MENQHWSFEEFKDLHENKGGKWFSKGATAFFKSDVMSWDGVTGYFISSEKGPVGSTTKYTIRHANFKTGSVTNASAFQEFDSYYDAKKEWSRLVDEADS